MHILHVHCCIIQFEKQIVVHTKHKNIHASSQNLPTDLKTQVQNNNLKVRVCLSYFKSYPFNNKIGNHTTPCVSINCCFTRVRTYLAVTEGKFILDAEVVGFFHIFK